MRHFLIVDAHLGVLGQASLPRQRGGALLSPSRSNFCPGCRQSTSGGSTGGLRITVVANPPGNQPSRDHHSSCTLQPVELPMERADFLTARPQVVKVGQFTSNSITLNIGAPPGCVLSPLLYSLYTHDCVSSHSSTSVIKFADDTVVLGLINNEDEAAYLHEVERITSWCQDNCLSLNVSKTKELIVDFRKRQQSPYSPLMISGTPVERVSSFKYLGVNISEDLTWTTHIQTQVKKARQRLYHLRQLRKFRVSPAILKTFYSGAIESVLTQCISVWYGNATNQDCKPLQRVVRLS